MALSRVQLSVLGVGASILLATQTIDTRAEPQAAAPNARRTTTANPITGEGLPNPAPVVTQNWGQLPSGRKWGTTAGIDIDPNDGNVWAYERCGAGTAGGGPVDCDNTPLDPVFKFDRKTGAVHLFCLAKKACPPPAPPAPTKNRERVLDSGLTTDVPALTGLGLDTPPPILWMESP